jgi:arylsulfatase A-like enzyme
MRAWLLSVVLGVSLAVPAQSQPGPAAQPPGTPKLVVAIVIDQFRYDYLTRFRSEYTGGLKRMLDAGANFTNARYLHVPTLTAPGHSTFLSGATPALSGIIANEWWDRTTGAQVTSVSDTGTRLLGADGVGSSPRRMLQSTLGDELKASGKGGKVIGISIKDRSAILPVGHTADAAYWIDAGSGNFVSSTYYFNALPAWVTSVNDAHPADRYAGREWLNHKMPKAGAALYDEIERTPYGNELIQQFALRALAAEKLGAGAKTDILAVSYSSNDYVGHRYGPDSEEVHDMALRVDKQVGELLQAAEAQAGAGNVLAVLTADHGVAPLPEVSQKRKMPGGRLDANQMRAAVEAELVAKFGGSHWVAFFGEAGVYLNLVPGVNPAEAENAAANALRAYPHISRVYTHTQLENGEVPADDVGTRLRNGFNSARSASVLFVVEPYWIVRGPIGTTHGTPYGYDTHVPMLFLGAGIKPGRYNANVAPNDIAPTLATLLDIETPSGSVGRVLAEMLK